MGLLPGGGRQGDLDPVSHSPLVCASVRGADLGQELKSQILGDMYLCTYVLM